MDTCSHCDGLPIYQQSGKCKRCYYLPTNCIVCNKEIILGSTFGNHKCYECDSWGLKTLQEMDDEESAKRSNYVHFL